MNPPPFFYHLVTPENWELYADSIFYEAASLQSEGFIHASTEYQLEATANRYFHGEPMLLLVKIEASKLSAPLKYEIATSVNEYFPHIYGPLNKDAIVEITELYAHEDGRFTIN